MNKQRRKILDGVAEDIAKLNTKVEEAKEKLAKLIEALEDEKAEASENGATEQILGDLQDQIDRMRDIASKLDGIEVEYGGAVT
jgi:uncharacterized protein YjbJ (UPF0337 family)